MLISVISIIPKCESSHVGADIPYCYPGNEYQVVTHKVVDTADPSRELIEVAASLYGTAVSTLGSCKPVEEHTGIVLSWTDSARTAIKIHRSVELEINRYVYTYSVKSCSEIGILTYTPVESIGCDSMHELAASQLQSEIDRLSARLRDRESSLEALQDRISMLLRLEGENERLHRENERLSAEKQAPREQRPQAEFSLVKSTLASPNLVREIQTYDRSRMSHIELASRPVIKSEIERAMIRRRAALENKMSHLLGIKN